MATNMDALVMEDFLLLKSEMSRTSTEAQRSEHLAKFELD
jgi:hypothetical protein